MTICVISIDLTNASFFDTEITNGNVIKAGVWNTTPTISDVVFHVSTPTQFNNAKAVVSWNTDILATGNLEWRFSPSDPWTASDPEDTLADQTTHTKELSGLLPLTTYYFRIKSKSKYGNETVSPEQHFATDHMRLGTVHEYSDLVINEFLPNPSGNDDALMPDGEWVELFNRSNTDSYDLTGWYLTDYDPSHRLSISAQNTVSSDPTTQGLIIGPQEFLVVYRNGNPLFSLGDDATGDQVNLYNAEGFLIDGQDYNSATNDIVLENKSFARFPDGSDYWFDPVPTAGKHNRL